MLDILLRRGVMKLSNEINFTYCYDMNFFCDLSEIHITMISRIINIYQEYVLFYFRGPRWSCWFTWSLHLYTTTLMVKTYYTQNNIYVSVTHIYDLN